MFQGKTKVLVLDDMLTMRKIVTKTCKDLGFSDIVEASNGEEGWKLLQETNPPIQLIISDWNMPNMSGLELLKAVRKHPTLGKVPFVLVTAEVEQHQILEAAKEGVDAYITKPFSADVFKERLVQVSNKHPHLKA